MPSSLASASSCRLLPPQRHLRRHHALPLGDQRALGAQAVLPAAEPLVALQRRHDAVVATPGALGRALVPLHAAPRRRGRGRRLARRRRRRRRRGGQGRLGWRVAARPHGEEGRRVHAVGDGGGSAAAFESVARFRGQSVGPASFPPSQPRPRLLAGLTKTLRNVRLVHDIVRGRSVTFSECLVKLYYVLYVRTMFSHIHFAADRKYIVR